MREGRGLLEPGASDYARRQAKRRFRRRPAIEPRIGYLKSDFHLGRNFLRGVKGGAINLLLAATAANLSLWLRRASARLVTICARLWAILANQASLRPQSA